MWNFSTNPNANVLLLFLWIQINIKINYTDTLFPFELDLDIPKYISKNGELEDKVNSLEYQVKKLTEIVLLMKNHWLIKSQCEWWIVSYMFRRNYMEYYWKEKDSFRNYG